MSLEVLLRRRQRIRPRNEQEAPPSCNGTTTTTPPPRSSSNHHHHHPCSRTARSVKWRKWLNWWTAAVHVAAFLMISVGCFLRGDFHSGDECEMTYSMRHFVELTNGPPPHSVYRLFKFTDRRDPRQQHLYTTHDTTTVRGHTDQGDWCTRLSSPVGNNATTAATPIVLYIPGHWGSYSQARSLGAHGLQWTRQHDPHPHLLHQQQDLLRNGTWNGQSATLFNFVYDVYAIDFLEQGGALHASFLHAQSSYVAKVIATLMTKCHPSHIVLVGHSMGGLVARKSLAMLVHSPTTTTSSSSTTRTTTTSSNLIITLATPHDRLPYGFDASIHEFYNLLDNSHDDDEGPTTLVSISGGLRDEMIPPSVCQVPNRSNNNNNNKTFSILATNLMANGVLGVDHRAIVWCHGLLEMVRNVLHVMIVPGNDSEKKLQRLLHQSDDYDQAVAIHYDTFRKRFGFLKSTAMESAMLYHFELLLGMYAVTGCVYHAFPSVPVMVVPCLVSVLGVWCTNHTKEVAVVVVLTLVANAMYCLVRWVLTRTNMSAHSIQSLPKSRIVWQGLLVFFITQLGVALFGYLRTRSIVCLSLTPAVFVSLILLLFIASLERRTMDNVTFLSLLLPVLPVLVAGKCYMIAWSLWMELDDKSMAGDLHRFVWKIVIPVSLRILIVVGERPRCAPFLHAVALFHFAPGVLEVGGGYVVGYLVACLAWMDVICWLGRILLFDHHFITRR